MHIEIKEIITCIHTCNIFDHSHIAFTNRLMMESSFIYHTYFASFAPKLLLQFQYEAMRFNTCNGLISSKHISEQNISQLCLG